MNARKHRLEALVWLDMAEQWQREDDQVNAASAAAIAQVHATLAAGRAKGKLLPLVDEQPADASADWNVAEASAQLHTWLTEVNETHPYWAVSMYGTPSIEAIVDTSETATAMAERFGVEVNERPQSNGSVQFVADATIRGWTFKVAFIQRAPKPTPVEVAEAYADAAGHTELVALAEAEARS